MQRILNEFPHRRAALTLQRLVMDTNDSTDENQVFGLKGAGSLLLHGQCVVFGQSVARGVPGFLTKEQRLFEKEGMHIARVVVTCHGHLFLKQQAAIAIDVDSLLRKV
jgi:hypothetical protein